MNKEQLTYPDGSTYVGETSGGKRHGEGTWVRMDGTKYKGQWKNDKPDGQGTIIWPDGKKYSGQWKNGKRHGEGIDINADGTKVEGVWEEGELRQKKHVSPQPAYKPEESFHGAEKAFNEESKKKKRKSKSELQSQSRGFLASLFDVSMQEMVTPKIIRIFYIIGLVVIGLGALGAIAAAVFAAFNDGVGALFGAIIAVPVGSFIAVIMLRIYMELIILLFNIYDQLKEIKEALER